MKKIFAYIKVFVFIIIVQQSYGQAKFEFDGQASAFANYSPEAYTDVLIAGR